MNSEQREPFSSDIPDTHKCLGSSFVLDTPPSCPAPPVCIWTDLCSS